MTRRHTAKRVRHTPPLWAPVLLLSIAAACAPVQSGTNQVPDINITINGVKDAAIATMPVEVDAVMHDFLAGTGDFAGAAEVPGCGVGIMENNLVTHVKGYGVANLTTSAAFTHVTASAVGSVSKTWTALATLRLVEMGLLNLNDTVGEFLPSAPAAWQGLTIEQLLSHTSGLARDPTFTSAINTEAELSEFWFGTPAVLNLGIFPSLTWVSYTPTAIAGFENGSDARYSNTAYMLIGAIIETIAQAHDEEIGEAFDLYESFVWRQVGMFEGTLTNGAQMTSQSLIEYWRQTDIPNLARGYTYDAMTDGFTLVPPLASGPAGWEGPPGGWTMTIGDLARLMAAIQSDAIVTPATKADMMTVRGSDSSGDWGLGVNRAVKLGRAVYLHDGLYPGYRARYTVWPDEGFGVAVMCNGEEASMRDVTDAIGTLFIGASPGGGGLEGGAFGGSDDGPRAGGIEMQARAGASRSGATASLRRLVDDNDPPMRPRITTTNTAPPPLTPDARARVAQVMREELAVQRALAATRDQRAAQAAALGCEAFVRSLLKSHGLDALTPLAHCAETSTTPDAYTRCATRAADDLRRRGLITTSQHTQLLRCAACVNVGDPGAPWSPTVPRALQ